MEILVLAVFDAVVVVVMVDMVEVVVAVVVIVTVLVVAVSLVVCRHCYAGTTQSYQRCDCN